MAKKTVLISDLSGEMIPEGKGATARLTYSDAQRGVCELHLTGQEAERLTSKGRSVARKGRRPKAAAEGANSDSPSDGIPSWPPTGSRAFVQRDHRRRSRATSRNR
jgi:hypothetical protein